MGEKLDYNQILKTLKSYANKKNVEGMARFGIKGENILGGPSLPILRKISKEIEKNHELALQLWNSFGWHDCRAGKGDQSAD